MTSGSGVSVRGSGPVLPVIAPPAGQWPESLLLPLEPHISLNFLICKTGTINFSPAALLVTVK